MIYNHVVSAVCRKNVYDNVEEYYVVIKEKGSREEMQSQEETRKKHCTGGPKPREQSNVKQHNGLYVHQKGSTNLWLTMNRATIRLHKLYIAYIQYIYI